MVSVYHKSNSNFQVEYVPGTENDIEGDYELVARIGTNKLETAYRETQNGNYPWVENETVLAEVGPTRSTSVGDVLVLNNRAWVVAPIGFEGVNFPQFGAEAGEDEGEVF